MKEKNFKAGLFVLLTLVLLTFMILRVGQGDLFLSSSYKIHLEVDSAVGLGKNTPVKIAGVDIGTVKGVKLVGKKAHVTLAINNKVILAESTRAQIKTTGILGDAYVEIIQDGPPTKPLKEGHVVKDVTNFGDFNSVTNEISDIAGDVKAITAQMRKLMAGDGSPFDNSMRNIEKITSSLAKVTTKNEDSINVIIANMKALSQNLNYVVAKNRGNIDQTFYNIEDITGTVARGEGTIGKLIKDEETVDNINMALDGINDFLGGPKRMRVDIGMHTEYLAGTGDFKNYVELYLKPRPDKFFLFEVVSDPDPSFTTVVEETEITSGTTTNTITTSTKSKKLDGMLFSAQIGKKFKDFTLRGGLMESSGGVALEYNPGPIGLSFQAFDFKSEAGQKPHLKALGRAQVTNAFYLLGGVDDIINPSQDLAWFVGAGLTFTDDDLKSLLGLFAAGAP